VIRYSLLVLAFVASAAAQQLQFGPAARVAPFSTGTPGGDYQGVVAPRVNGFAVYWSHGGELWSESVTGSTPRPDLSTAQSLGVFPDAYAETVNGPIVLESDGVSTSVHLLNTPSPTVIHGIPDGIECNSTRCLVSVDNGNTLAVVDTNAQLVKLLPFALVGGYRVAWATDPNGFLFLRTAALENRAISIDNSGGVRADVKIDLLPAAAVTFNGDRYVVFDGSGAGVTAFTMTVDGQFSSPKTLSTTPMLPAVVAWNGSEYLLAGPPNLVTTIPEFVPPNELSGLRIAPDLTPIGTQPFQIAPSDGANYPTSIAWNGNTFYVVWTHTLGSLLTHGTISSTVEGAAVSATGDVVTRDLLSWGSVPQTWPRIAQGGQTIIVWSELDVRSGAAALHYSRNGHAFTVATGFAIDVVPLGEDYLVTWTDARRTHAAILTSDQTWSEVPLPPFSDANVAAAANHDHWLLAGSVGSNVITVVVSRDGTVSPPKVIAQLPYVYGLASDGERFFLATQQNFILDAAGSTIVEKPTNFGASQVDFAGGVYGALGGLGTLDRYDRDGNYLGSTKYSAGYADPRLSHIGSRFVIVDANIYEPRASIVGADGTVLARDVPVPDVMIAKTDATTSAAVEMRSVTDTWGRPTPALFVETVSIPDTPPHRAVKH
jgi:hypothetical protein